MAAPDASGTSPALVLEAWFSKQSPCKITSYAYGLSSPIISSSVCTATFVCVVHQLKWLGCMHRTLGALAEKCHAFAKALHYKELEYQRSPETAVEALISINNHLRQPEAAVGILTVAQQHLHLDLRVRLAVPKQILPAL